MNNHKFTQFMSAKYHCNENSLPSYLDIEYGALTLYTNISTTLNAYDSHTNYQYSYMSAPNIFPYKLEIKQ